MHHIHRRRLPSLAIVLAALVCALIVTAPAHASFTYSEPLRNQKDEGFCIGIGQRPNPVGTHAGLYSCDGRINQDYRFLGGILDNQIRVNNGTGLCLKVSEHVDFDGSRAVYQGYCNTGGEQAHWQLTNRFGSGWSGGPASYRYASIMSRHVPGYCIGVPGGAIFHGTEIKTYPCVNNDYGNQNWLVNPSGSTMPY
jgi:hypothetical protein